MTLQCYECTPDASGTCTDTQTNCSDQCGTFTTLWSTSKNQLNGTQEQSSRKTCATAAQCVNGSINLGTSKRTINSQCCSTDLCNTQSLTALSFGSPNGKQCYTCTDGYCTGILSCEGDADQCISVTALTLKCLQCLPVQFGTCTDTQVDCSDQCAYATALVSMGGKPKSVYLKTCATAAECVTGSVNLGIINMTIRSQCCSTALCNNQTLSALESSPPNGKTCYTCTLDNNCTKTVNCEGDADQCVAVKALALQCYQCIPGLTGTCTDTQVECPDQCGSFSALLSTSGVQQQLSTKTCATAAQCISGSANLGSVKLTLNSQCCSTALCNSQLLPAVAFGSANGKQCYACTGTNCKDTVNCEGDADQCISVTATAAGTQVSVKGCASKTVCAAGASSLQVASITGSVSCCEGNLCNSAAGVKLSLLIMLIPLLSSFFL
ncbi:hypothetical protein NFI96_018197 [Prochilodus magdalenae]|nr:hypothetical protein NFI96_018197 [Prochilodus magdalenae]